MTCGISCATSTIRFTGKERDGETGLDWFGARYYSGVQGRFTSPDPFSILQEAGSREGLDDFLSNPQHWNKYAFSLNNPLKYVDPDGNHPILVHLSQLLQRAAASPTGQRITNYASTQGTKLYNAAARFFNSPTGQELSQSAIETVSGVPLGVSISTRSVFAREVNAALESAEAGVRLEGQLGKQLLDRLVGFKNTVREAGVRKGEIDLEVGNAIIEATLDQGGKTKQIQKLLTDRTINPSGKAVVLYAPNIRLGAARDIQRVGGKVARTPEELEDLLRGIR